MAAVSFRAASPGMPSCFMASALLMPGVACPLHGQGFGLVRLIQRRQRSCRQVHCELLYPTRIASRASLSAENQWPWCWLSKPARWFKPGLESIHPCTRAFRSLMALRDAAPILPSVGEVQPGARLQNAVHHRNALPGGPATQHEPATSNCAKSFPSAPETTPFPTWTRDLPSAVNLSSTAEKS